MPFNGSGTFNRLYSWVVDAANNVNISSSRMDGELNGIAAALTNCLTRDGQSPPSAATPWGGMRLTNLGAATSGTDALNRDTADARYILTGSAITCTTLTASGVITGNAGFVGTTLSLSGTASASAFGASGQVNTYGAGYSHSRSGQVGYHLSNGGGIDWIAYQPAHATDDKLHIGTGVAGAITDRLVIDTSGNATFGGAVITTTQSPGDNSTKAATTAFVTAAISAAGGSYAPLASPALTGTPTAPTAAAGTATTQLATTAFVDGLRDVPSNAKTANYALALTDRGGGVDFNGTSLTCTIPANASVAFPIGTVILLTNLNSTSLSIPITSDTLTLAGTVTTGTRTLSQNGVATLRKVGSTSWIISGSGLS